MDGGARSLQVSLRPTRAVAVACMGAVHSLLAPASRRLLAGALPHPHDHGVSQHLSAPCPGGGSPTLGPAAECSSPHSGSGPSPGPSHLDFCFGARPPCAPTTPFQPPCPQTPASGPSLQPLLHPSQETGCRARGQCTVCHCGHRSGEQGGRAWPRGRSGPGSALEQGQARRPACPPSLPLDAGPDAGSDVSAHLLAQAPGLGVQGPAREGAEDLSWSRASHSASQPVSMATAVSWSTPSLHALGRASGPPGLPARHTPCIAQNMAPAQCRAGRPSWPR